jgi:hypothetical protein
MGRIGVDHAMREVAARAFVVVVDRMRIPISR